MIDWRREYECSMRDLDAVLVQQGVEWITNGSKHGVGSLKCSTFVPEANEVSTIHMPFNF